MGLLDRFRMAAPRAPLDDLYHAVVARARDPLWYTAGAVPDTVDGRFDMVALITSLVLIRLERETDPAHTVALTERFVDDMDGSLRELGVGDMTIGKHVGRTVSALGGRLGAYRSALAGEVEPLSAALARNLYRGAPPSAEALEWTAAQAQALADALADWPADALLAGRLP
ncbi:MAG: ubiquinol-cytochrome C chaperone [Alphaproteobacteria bacterium]|nr:ubiquinol-cytochrome C chaperone [Alphaproteobacteria bacterium]